MSDYGTVTFADNSVIVSADNAQLWRWANRSGARWPCSALATYDLVAATFDRTGDLVDLQVIEDGADSDANDLTGDELTAWADDVRAASPFADDGGGITPEGLALGHRYIMGNVNAYCPKCSDEQGVCVLDCDYDLDK